MTVGVAHADEFWIDDDPFVVSRVIALLQAYPGTPLCDTCIADGVAAPLRSVRNVMARLAERRLCEQGLWWCSRCSSQGYVSLVAAGTIGAEFPVPPERPPPVAPKAWRDRRHDARGARRPGRRRQRGQP
jgi:hypothetical protein